MKNTIRVMALVMALLMVGVLLVSCGKTLSGTYSAEVAKTGVTFEFSGKKATITSKAVGVELFSVEGTYEIDGDKITFSFEDSKAEEYSGTFDFEEGDDYIKIGVVKYTKK